MVKYKNNYINLVVLGSFNPAILTHDFLTKECGLDLAGEPRGERAPVPVVASLEYGKLAFFADLGRFQITENGCDAPEKSLIPQYLQTYLQKLPYTPLKKCGANFSYELYVDEAKLNTVHSWLKSGRKNILETLSLPGIGVEVSFEVAGSAEQIKTWILRTEVEKNKVATMAKFYYGDGGKQLCVDFNFEVSDLDKDRNLLDMITTGYRDVFNLFKNQIETIFGG